MIRFVSVTVMYPDVLAHTLRDFDLEVHLGA